MPDLADPPSKPEMSAFERAFEEAGEPAVVKETEPIKETKAAPEEKKADAAPANPKRAPELKKASAEPAKVEKAAEAEKPPESEFDKLPEPKFKDEHGAANFKALREKAKAVELAKAELDKKVAEAQTRITELEAKGKDTEELKAKLTKLETENAENMKLVRQANIELDPEFRREFIDGRAARVVRISKIVEEAGGDSKEIETALNLKGRAQSDAIAAATQDLPAYQQSRIARVIEELVDLDERAAAKRTNPETYLEERQKQTQADEARHREQSIEEKRRAWTIAQDEVRKSNELFQPAEGRDEHNRSVEAEFLEAQRRFEGNASPLDTAKDAILARSVPRLIDYVRAEQEYSAELETKLAERDAELKALYGKSPSLRGGTGGEKGGKKGFWDVMNADE